MRFISFTHQGKAKFGVLEEGGGVFDLTDKLPSAAHTLKGLLESGALTEAKAYIRARKPDFDEADITYLPVITSPAKIFCIGVNYQAHRLESARPVSEYPTVFTRFSDTLTGHKNPLIRPSQSHYFDFEGELAVIIGTSGRHISEAKAMDHVAGYAGFNDGTLRDWQRHSSQFTPGKNFAQSGAFGPFLLSRKAVPNYRDLPICTRLNGEKIQQATLDDLIFPIPALISYISSFTPLAPGDVIATGTPGGVGDKRTPPIYLRPGDRIEVDLGPVGVLINSVQDAQGLS